MEQQIQVIEENREQEINVQTENGEQTIQIMQEPFISGGSSVVVLPYQESYNIKDLDDGIYEITPDAEEGFPNLVIYQSNTEQNISFGGGYLFVNKSTIGEITYIAYQFNTLQESGSTSDTAIVCGGILINDGDAQGFYTLIEKPPTALSELTQDSNYRTVTDTEKTTWNNKADYGFTGVITGTSANPTDGSTLANGTYMADPSKASSYISLSMEDGTTKKQTVQKGGIVIRTAGRLIVLATQNLLFQYNTTQHYFYEGEPLVESYTRTSAPDEQCYLGTVAPPNNKIVTDPIYLLDGEINTGTTGHVRIIFTVIDDLEETPFEYSLTLASGDDILYENGEEPEFKEGHTYMLEFYGSTCQVLEFSDTPSALSYTVLSDKPQITYTGTSISSRVVTQTTNTETINGTKPMGSYGAYNFIPLDMSSYNSQADSKALLPETHLPDGTYVVTAEGYMKLDNETKKMRVGSIIYWWQNELYLIGYNACEYWYYNEGDGWAGGYFTTQEDVESILADKIGYQIRNNTSATTGVSMDDGIWTKKTRATGVTKLTMTFPLDISNYNFKSKLTCKTASNFTEFTVTARDYDIYFYGDDCANGVLTGQQSKYYEIEARHDGFDGLIVEVFAK